MVQSNSPAKTAGNRAHGSFTGKLAVVTGGGSDMGRELARQLAARGYSVAACDWHADTVAQTAVMAREGAPPGVRVTWLTRAGLLAEGASDDEVRLMLTRLDNDFRTRHR
jgi:NAD(P)-dependent dehydrogenase (short-subunit alcohol dehydrogenase family)